MHYWPMLKLSYLDLAGANLTGAVLTNANLTGIKPRTFPITGLDASFSGLQNILADNQCGTVYKPIYLEAPGLPISGVPRM
jgi:uncharacterized protein YjbI with pentapeptide repeats